MGSETILFVGAHYEVKNPGSSQEVTKYYFAGTSRIAMRKYTVPVSMSVEYFLSDHLGSTSITTDNAGTKISEMRYKPWGEVRYSWTATQVTTPSYKLSAYTFTGQYSYMDDPSTSGVSEGFGLMFYNARMYDPALGRFTSADSIVPGGVQGYDRYAYVNNSPVNYVDPTGHESVCGQANSDPECGDLGHSPLSHPPSGGGGNPGGGLGGGGDLGDGIGAAGESNSNNNSENLPKDNLKLPYEEWKTCVYLYITETCGYGSSSLKLEFSDLAITTSSETLSVGDISINHYGDLDYSFKIFSSFYGNNEFSSGLGVSINSLNSIKFSGELSVTLQEDNASGNLTTGISHEYHPGNQVMIQTIGGVLAGLWIINPQIGSQVSQRLIPAR